MTETMLQWLLGAVGALIVTIVGAMAIVTRTAFRLGGISRDVQTSISEIRRMQSQLKKIATHDTRISQLETVVEMIREDVKHLLHGSRPDSEE